MLSRVQIFETLRRCASHSRLLSSDRTRNCMKRFILRFLYKNSLVEENRIATGVFVMLQRVFVLIEVLKHLM